MTTPTTLHASTSLTGTEADDLFRRISWRILPLLGLVWFLALVDRANLSFARIDEPFMDQFRFTDAQFGFINGIFYLGYCVFAIPSNLALERLGAKRWIACILGMWGGMTVLIALAHGFQSFSSLRFLLGVAEAGSYPAILLCITYWFPPSRRAMALALFSLSQPLAGVFGSFAAGWLLVAWHDLGGLPGWQWLFIVEGGLALAAVGVILLLLPDRPGTAGWMSAADRELHARALAAECGPPGAPGAGFLRTLADPALWLLVATYFAYIFCVYGLGAWLPKFTREIEFFRDLNPFRIGMLVAVPAILAAPLAIWWARRSDRLGERAWHAAIPALVCAGAAALAGTAAVLHLDAWWILAGLLVTAVGMTAAAAPFWGLAGRYLPERAVAPGIALINCLGCLGGFAGPYLLGYLKDVAREGLPARAPAGLDPAALAEWKTVDSATAMLGTAWGMWAVALSFAVFAVLCLACAARRPQGGRG